MPLVFSILLVPFTYRIVWPALDFGVKIQSKARRLRKVLNQRARVTARKCCNSAAGDSDCQVPVVTQRQEKGGYAS